MWKPIDIKDVVYRGYGGAAGPVDLRLARTVVERSSRNVNFSGKLQYKRKQQLILDNFVITCYNLIKKM